MAGLFESGFRQTMRDAQRRGITSPDQTPTTFSDVYSATWDVSKVEGVTGGVARRQNQLILQQMERMAEFDPEFDPMRFVSNAPDLYRVAEVEHSELALDFFKNSSERIKELSTQHGQEFQTFDDIKARVEREQAELRAIRDQIAQRASPTDKALGSLAGEGQAIMTDPIIAGSMGLGGTARGATAATRIATAMASEAAIIGSIEATMVQPQVYLQKRSINSPYSLVDAGIAVLTAGAGGAAFRGVFQGGASAIEAYRAVRGARTRQETVQQLRDAAGEIAAEGTPGAQTEAQVLEDLADVIESTPSGRAIDQDTGQEFYDQQRVLVEPDEETQHLSNLDQAMDDLAQNRITEVSMDTDPVEYIARSTDIESVDPRTVAVDAKRFQFKAGGDTEGVTDRLKGVEEWDPMRAGISVIYEQADGARFIVDGHQRLALAKRLNKENIRLNAIVLREVDGVTVADARQRAAMKNVAEGTGTSLDAAKVLREMGPEALAEMPGLPPQSALVRTARSLAELEQDAFEYVANALKPEQYAMASIVGELIKAGPEQLAAIRALVESNPGTLLQARFIVEQIRAAGFETTETMDLFGGQTISETLFKERARVLDNAIKRLKKDKATFRTLVERESEITGAGNVLERQSNLERLGEDEETIQTLARLANAAGPISDALNEAARKLKNGERVDSVTRDFLAAARRPADEERGPGTEVRDAGRRNQEAVPTEDLAPQIGRAVELDTLSELNRLKAEELFRAKQQRKVKTLRGLVGKDAKLAQKHQKELEKLGDEIAQEVKAEHRAPASGHKTIEQIERKVKDKYDGQYGKITDVTRTSFIVDTPDDAVAVVKELSKRLAVLDEGWHVDPVQGYMDRKVLVRYSDGIIGEVQIIGREMHNAKFELGGHQLYYKWRQTFFKDGTTDQVVIKDQAAYESLNREMSELYEAANQRSNADFQSLSESVRPSDATSLTSTVRQRLPGSTLDQAVKPPLSGSRTTTAGIPSQESQPITLSRGGEEASNIDDVSEPIISPNRETEVKQYVNDTRALLPDDPEIDELAAAEARQVADILEQNPDLEIPVEIRVDADGNQITETRKASEVYDDLVEEDTRTTDMFTCMTGGGRG